MPGPFLNRRALSSLAGALRHWRALPCSHLGSQLRELIILHVSSVNDCPVCSLAHGVMGRAVGLDAEAIRDARKCVPDERFARRTKAALRFAELRTLDQEDTDPEAVADFERLFDADQQREVRAIVDLFTFNNRFNNSWEGVLPGARRRRERMGLCGRANESAS